MAITGLVSTEQALSGFSNPAVITVWAVFILGGALHRTGVASILGVHVSGWAGRSEPRMIAVVMLTSGALSAFMNNVAVAALMLPVVIDLARKASVPPSRLLIPLAYGTLLGGLTTMIGTPPNILVSASMQSAGQQPFGLFDFTPIGVIIMLAGTVFMVFVGRHLLPKRDPLQESVQGRPQDLADEYDLAERLFTMQIPEGSVFHGLSLGESGLGAQLGLHVVGVIRQGRISAAPGPSFALQQGDRLLVEARLEQVRALRGWRTLEMVGAEKSAEGLLTDGFAAAEIRVSEDSALSGVSLKDADFRNTYGVTVFSLFRDGNRVTGDLRDVRFLMNDTLLVHGESSSIENLAHETGLENFQMITSGNLGNLFEKSREMLVLQVPAGGELIGRSLREAGLAEVMGMVVLLVQRADGTKIAPFAGTVLEAGDHIFVKGSKKDLQILRGLDQLTVESQSAQLASGNVGMAEAVLSPRSNLAGKTLRQINFRDKFALSVLAIWRGGRAYRTNLASFDLRHGDSLLLLGPAEKLNLLGRDADFIVLNGAAKEPPRLHKAKIAVAIMAAVLLPVIVGWVPISVAAVVGAALMVVSGCLTMAEAYRAIEWKAVFLIAGMLPLGIALDESGTAKFLADNTVSLAGSAGPYAVMGGLLLLTFSAKLVIPSAALVVLMAPIILNAAADLGVSSATMMMGLAMAASSSFMSPIAHPSNLLVMGPGGYRFSDYVKVGLPMTILIFLLVMLIVPLLWPF